MRLWEAVESGKPFRLKGSPQYFRKHEIYNLAYSEIIGDKWEIEEEKRELTAEQVINAIKITDYEMYSNHTPDSFLKLIITELGFKGN